MSKVSLKYTKKDEVPAEGPEDADIAIVGEAPGKDEVRKGRPFVGSSGRLLNQLLDSAGIQRNKCYITNVVKRKLPGNNFSVMYNKTYPTEELKEYRMDLKQELRKVCPNIIICLGKEAAKAVLEREDFKITKERGSIFNSPYGKVIATYHPARILRVWQERPILFFDLQQAKREAQAPELDLPVRDLITEPQKNEVLDFLEECKEHEKLSFDIETKELEEGNWFIDCLGLAFTEDYGMCIPFTKGGGKPYWDLLDEAEIRWAIAEVLYDQNIKKIAQNAQYDIYFLRQDGMPVRNLWFDTMNASHVVYPEFPKGLDFLVSIYTDEPYYKDTSTEERWIYNAKDATCTYEVHEGLLRDLEETKTEDFYFSHVHPMLEMYIEVSDYGIRIDMEKYEEVQERLDDDIKEKREKLKEAAGQKVNVNPSNSLKKFLYETLGAKERRTEKGNLKTDEDTLKKIRKEEGADIITDILELRKLRDVKSSYFKLKFHEGNRVKTNYKVSGTKTGRLSSTKTADGRGMNLQNVDKTYRDMFIPDEGFVFLGADLAQAENRVVAYMCQDRNMMELVETEGDMHTNNAAIIFGKAPGAVTEEERSLGKRITHSSNYMVGPRKFAKVAGIPVRRAKKLLKQYYRRYPKLKAWHKEISDKLRKDKTLVNPFGRKRVFNGRMNKQTFRKAVAFLPQSTVADCLHRAAYEMYAKLQHPARVAMNLHDEMFIQVPDEEEWIEYGKKVMKEALERPFEIKGKEISIPTDVKKGYNWKDAS